jgi:hypothetical protein
MNGSTLLHQEEGGRFALVLIKAITFAWHHSKSAVCYCGAWQEYEKQT